MDNSQPKQRGRSPIAVVTADVHVDMPTLDVSISCLKQAIAKANDLEVPLIVAGDLHNTKANMRGECIKAMLDAFDTCDQLPFILRGNHCAINERSTDHSLEFLRSSAHIISHPVYEWRFDAHFIPYQHDPEEMRRILAQIPTGSRLIIHQGRHGALPGSYSHDRSALSEADYAPFKVISGHYHNHQVMGNFTYIGNPYTLNFGEHNDHPKGFIILNDDFSIEHVRTNVRKHVLVEIEASELCTSSVQESVQGSVQDFVRIHLETNDILSIKIHGWRSELAKIDRALIEQVMGRPDFRLDLIPTDSEVVKTGAIQDRSATELFTALIDKHERLSEDDKETIKNLWLEHSA